MDRPYKVMIDPGHGGRHPGAVNSRLNLLEKDINMSVCRHILGIACAGDYLFEPKMTRVSDISISLKERCLFANGVKADAFVSVHCNARFRQQPGIEIETYHYPGSMKGNNLASLIQQGLLEDVGKKGSVINRGVKQKAFYVLKHTIMPAALVELGFITDDDEALFLNEPNNQKVMAKSITDSIELFLEGGGI